MATNCIPNEAVGGRNGQCFGLYTYSEDGQQRLDNITDWSLSEFRTHYGDNNIAKRDIFNYVYAILHHPLYRDYFAANLQKDNPRIPIAPDFWECANIGQKLIDFHLGYETAPRFELQWFETPNMPLSYRVTDRMHLDKEAHSIKVNDSLTLTGIPEDAFEYVLGTRCPLEWIVDQYQFEKDDEGSITLDPNDPDNEQYIVHLIEQVTFVSVATMELTRSLPPKVDFNEFNRDQVAN
jgi:predicted helicase